jgi:hypothetical protein
MAACVLCEGLDLGDLRGDRDEVTCEGVFLFFYPNCFAVCDRCDGVTLNENNELRQDDGVTAGVTV